MSNMDQMLKAADASFNTFTIGGTMMELSQDSRKLFLDNLAALLEAKRA